MLESNTDNIVDINNGNPFLATIGDYIEYDNTKFHQVSGTFQSIKNFLEDDNIEVNHATIKYTTCINFILPYLFKDSPIKDDKNIFEEMNGNLKFDYIGSDEEFEELFSRYDLKCYGDTESDDCDDTESDNCDCDETEPIGLNKPVLISNGLSTFLGKPDGTKMSRADVLRDLSQYIKTHDLQDATNRQKIIPDQKFQTLLNVTPSDEVTYFNLQKYMKVHFNPIIT